ncbi:universal stress protein [Rhodococcus sp. NPDC049939]|uniref:universal stress protein n=1 Tax=Rhodococcus sp. NPDC049939 TaxID=3155511 RepID=UPI0033D46803
MSARRPILVGTDGSASSLQAVAWAAQEAALRSSPLLVITTNFVPGGYGIPMGVPANFFEDEQRDAKNRLAAAVQLAADTVPGRSSEVEATLCTGTPAGELIERSKSAAMVVVGPNKRGIIERGFLGSVSSAVIAHAQCPAAVVRANPDYEVTGAEGPVVVGVDGSEHSMAAISIAFEEAALRGCELVAVHAWSDVKLPKGASGDDESRVQHALTEQTAVLSASLAGRAEEFPDVDVRMEVVIDDPVRNLRKQADNARLLVVGSRGRGGFTSMLLGSTSRALMHSVRCPLLIVR